MVQSPLPESSDVPRSPVVNAPEDVLPNVTPPSASFILQLFLIPLMIVAIIVAVWMGFSWLAHLGANPEDMVTDVEKLNAGSWQQALTLADMLRNPKYDHLKDDSQLAQRLANVLHKQLAEGSLDKNRINLRLYLAKGLGEFRTPVVLPALVEAATLERDAEVERTADPRMWFPKEVDVRRAALESFAVLADENGLGAEKLREQQDVVQAVLSASREFPAASDPNDDRAKLRQTAAFTLGVMGGEAALSRLAHLLSDSFPNTRYNAAIGLARHGDARAITGLIEMLDPENDAVVASEGEDADGQYWKRALVMMNALRASKQLQEKNPSADLSRLYEAMEKALDPKYEDDVHLEVREAARELRAVGKKAA